MSIADKAKNVVQQTVGKAEEAVGKRTDDQEQIAQGKKDQAMGEARQEHEKAKDALDDK
ncbi:CsbD family protein [Kineococcus sp. TBRC 1896]|uniref:CsbD family protein n=1 Tax=Kineococcus mangrovi TaxID=1660183 RepID=A0ABV4I263_9ACTN